MELYKETNVQRGTPPPVLMNEIESALENITETMSGPEWEGYNLQGELYMYGPKGDPNLKITFYIEKDAELKRNKNKVSAARPNGYICQNYP